MDFVEAIGVLAASQGAAPTDYGPAAYPGDEQVEEALNVVVEKMGFAALRKDDLRALISWIPNEGGPAADLVNSLAARLGL